MKKALLVGLSALLLVALTVGMTVAYLTDRDTETNVFTWGNVEIDLTEDFEQGATLVPGVDIDKVPTIKNTGDNDAWVWMTFSVPAALDNWNPAGQEGSSLNVIHWNPLGATAEGFVNQTRVDSAIAKGLLPAGTTAEAILDANSTWNVFNDFVDGGNAYRETINGVEYNTYVLAYNKALETDEETLPCVYNVFLDAQVDISPEGDLYRIDKGNVTEIDWNVNTDGKPVVYVAAYGMQTEGFATVKDAFNAYVSQWSKLNAVYTTTTVAKDASELNEAIADAEYVYLIQDVETGRTDIADGTEVTVDLNQNTLNATIVNEGDLSVIGGTLESETAGIENYGNATLTNVDVNAGSPADYSNIHYPGSETVYNDVDIVSKGGGIGAVAGAKVVFNSGSVAVNSASTSGRYIFYTEGAGAEIVINGGEFSFSKTLNQKRAYIYAGADTTVYINGGTFGPASTRSGYTSGILGSGTVIITGGTFGFDPSNWVADGYQAVKDGSVWTVTAK